LSAIDLCLFLKDDLVALVYIDDVLFFGKLEKIIDQMIKSLKKNFDLNVEDTVEDVFWS